MPKGYVIVNANVTDPDKYADYRPLSTKAIEAFGGKVLVRGGQSETLEGSLFPRAVVLEVCRLRNRQKVVSLRRIRSGAPRARRRGAAEHDGRRRGLSGSIERPGPRAVITARNHVNAE